MGVVIVKREQYIIRNLFLVWNVYVDGKRIARLPDAKTVSFGLDEGSHEIRIGGGTPFYPFARNWVRSNKIIFSIKKDETIRFRTNYHPCWNLVYRRPDLLHPSESLVLLPVNETYDDAYIASAMKALSDKRKALFSGYRRPRYDIVLQSIFILLFISLPLLFRNSFSGLTDWFGFCFIAGLVTLLTEMKPHVISGRSAFLSFTILLGYKNTYTNLFIALAALLLTIFWGIRYVRQYRTFKRLNGQLKESDVFLGTIKLN